MTVTTRAIGTDCPRCRFVNPAGFRFCGHCGGPLVGTDEGDVLALARSGRRYVTVLFTDLSGYTALCERLDPEDVTEIMGRVIGEIRAVAAKYAGSIEKFVGDAALVVFGVPEAHEDDQVRAIKAALEIHARVKALSARVEAHGGRPISMHSGVNSGLVVTQGSESIREGMGVTGDTINLASRLSDLACPGEILVGPHTFRTAEGFFRFEALEPARVGGRAEPVRPYKVLAALEEPRKTRRLSGLRAELVGRQAELASLADAAARLRRGEPGVIAIVGDAGTGKSRLVEEFKASLDPAFVQWHEGHAYAYSQNIHYSPLIHLLGRSLRIEEEDSPDAARAKLDAAIRALTDRADEIVPYVGGLFSLRYPEAEAIDPETWKARLHDGVLKLLSALGRRAPMVVCVEDLHWADPSSLELLRLCMSSLEAPALFLFTYRPGVELLPPAQRPRLRHRVQTIRLRELSPAETRRMVGSLLGDGQVSEALGEFVQSRGEGNPFYIEEVINSLIETESVVPDEGGWRIVGSSGGAKTPPTIQEVITARLDRLDPDAKLVVQEASVIGRSFLEPVLRAITASSAPLERSLDTLERLDLIRTKSRHPYPEYVFKHALIQEAVYGGLLLRQRRELHERVGAAVESFVQDRASEFVETLAFHYKQGLSGAKAVEYLVASGDRALKRFALEESHRYYEEAFQLIAASGAETEEDRNRLVDLLVAWAVVYYYRAQFKEITNLLGAHRALAENLQDASRKGMFFAWLGFSCFWQGEDLRAAYAHLRRALALGEAAKSDRVVGYACAFLTLTCAELGLLGECDAFIRRTRVIAARYPGEALMALNYLAAMGYLGWFSGNKQLPRESATWLLEHGRETSNLRHQMVGSIIMAMHHFMAFDLDSATRLVDHVVRSSQDPLYADYARVLLGMFHLVKEEYGAAESHLRRTIEFHDRAGTRYLKANACAFLGAVLAATGRIEQGVRMIESSRDELRRSGRRVFQAMSELLLGDIYRQLATRAAPVQLVTVLRNFRFLARNYVFAARRAEQHLRTARDVLAEAGASGFLAPVQHRLGLLYAAQGRDAEAEVALEEAVRLFEACEATAALQEAERALAALRARREPLCAGRAARSGSPSSRRGVVTPPAAPAGTPRGSAGRRWRAAAPPR